MMKKDEASKKRYKEKQVVRLLAQSLVGFRVLVSWFQPQSINQSIWNYQSTDESPKQL